METSLPSSIFISLLALKFEYLLCKIFYKIRLLPHTDNVAKNLIFESSTVLPTYALSLIQLHHAYLIRDKTEYLASLFKCEVHL